MVKKGDNWKCRECGLVVACDDPGVRYGNPVMSVVLVHCGEEMVPASREIWKTLYGKKK